MEHVTFDLKSGNLTIPLDGVIENLPTDERRRLLLYACSFNDEILTDIVNVIASGMTDDYPGWLNRDEWLKLQYLLAPKFNEIAQKTIRRQKELIEWQEVSLKEYRSEKTGLWVKCINLEGENLELRVALDRATNPNTEQE